MLDSAPTFGGIKDGLFNSKASLLTGDARRAASAPFGADLARDRPPDPLNAPDPPAAGAAPGAGSPPDPPPPPRRPPTRPGGPTVSPALFSAGSNEARTVIRPNFSANPLRGRTPRKRRRTRRRDRLRELHQRPKSRRRRTDRAVDRKLNRRRKVRKRLGEHRLSTKTPSN